VREVRLVLKVMPRFLADLVRAVLAGRLAAAGYALTIVDEPDASTQARRDSSGAPAPDVVIIGALSAGADASTPSSRLLRLSSTLDYIMGPDDAPAAPLTPDELTARVLGIVREIERGV
jgi:hypothetical protein